ncbi:MAG: trigger factor [Candidatus Poribacteria bacterium]
MKVSIQDAGSGKKIIRVEIPTEDVNAEFEKAYEEVRKNIEVPGFRKGRAPRNILKMRFGEYIKNEVIESLVPPAYEKVIEESNLDIVGSPDIYPPIEQSLFSIDAELQNELDKEEIPEILKQEFIKNNITISDKAIVTVSTAGKKWILTDGRKRYIISKNNGTTYVQIDELLAKENEPLIFEISVDVKPSIEIPDYSLLEINKGDVNVTEEEVKEYIESLREQSAIYEPIEDRPAQEGDTAIFNYSITYEDVVKHSQQNVLIDIGKMNDNLEFKEVHQALIGMKPGEEKDITLKLPDNFSNTELAGKEVNLHINLKNIYNKQLPELNDDFAKEKGAENLEQLTAKLWNNLVESKRKEKRENQEAELIYQLIEKTQIDVPESLIELRAKKLVENIKDRNFTEEEIKSLKEFSEKMIKMDWIIDEIIEREDITVDDLELDMVIQQMAIEKGKDPQKYKSQLEATKRIDDIEYNILKRKVFDLLIEKASAKKSLIV